MNLFTPFADRKHRPQRCRCGLLFTALVLAWLAAIVATISLANQTWHAASGFRLLSTLNERPQP